MRNDEISNAVELLEDLEPTAPQRYILKAVTMATDGEYSGDVNRDSIVEAQCRFQSVGISPNETDIIPCRQCMAQFYFLQGHSLKMLIST